MKFKLVQCFNHNTNNDSRYKLEYVVLKSGTLKEIDNFTTKYIGSGEVRDYFKDKIIDKRSSIVIVYHDDEYFERKMNVIYKDNKEKTKPQKVQEKIINYLKEANLKEGIVNYKAVYKSNNGKQYPKEKVLYVLNKYPYFFGAATKYKWETYSNRMIIENRSKRPTKTQQKVYEEMQTNYKSLSTYIPDLENRYMIVGEHRQLKKDKLVVNINNYFNSIRKTNNDYLYYVLRRLNSNFEKSSDYVDFKVTSKNTEKKKNRIEYIEEDEKDPEWGNPDYHIGKGMNDSDVAGYIDYQKMLQAEEALDNEFFNVKKLSKKL